LNYIPRPWFSQLLPDAIFLKHDLSCSEFKNFANIVLVLKHANNETDYKITLSGDQYLDHIGGKEG